MIECLAMNPDYVSWGPHEDYMWGGKEKEERKSWDSPIYMEGWENFDWKLDDYNEIVNFYFEVQRNTEDCATCGASGYNPQTHQLSEDYYDFADTGRKWCYSLTQDDIDYLISKRRLPKEATPEEVNNPRGKHGMDMDAINKWLLIEYRAKKAGFYGECSRCSGKGYLYTEPRAHLNLILWVLHPRKGCSRGCSRGVEIRYIKKQDLPSVIKILKEAAKRNKNRFSKLNILDRIKL